MACILHIMRIRAAAAAMLTDLVADDGILLTMTEASLPRNSTRDGGRGGRGLLLLRLLLPVGVGRRCARKRHIFVPLFCLLIF